MNQIVTENLTKVKLQRGSPQSQGWAGPNQFLCKYNSNSKELMPQDEFLLMNSYTH